MTSEGVVDLLSGAAAGGGPSGDPTALLGRWRPGRGTWFSGPRGGLLTRGAARRLEPGPSPDWSGPLREEFFDALADDFNTPRALAPLWSWIRRANASANASTGSPPAARAARKPSSAPGTLRQAHKGPDSFQICNSADRFWSSCVA